MNIPQDGAPGRGVSALNCLRLPADLVAADSRRMPNRILVMTGDAGESCECLYARHRLLATFVTEAQAVRDGRVVTGQTWQSHPEFYRLAFGCPRAAREEPRGVAAPA